MNLENFPTSETAKKMLMMVSQGFYDDSYVGKWLYQVMGAQLDAIGGKVEDLPYQAYVDTATWGLRYWEQAYGIETDESLSYEERRAEIHAREDNGEPINPERVRLAIERLSGRGCAVQEVNSEYKFKIILERGDNVVNWKRLVAWLNKIKPAHLSYNFGIEIEEELALGTGSILNELKKINVDIDSYDISDIPEEFRPGFEALLDENDDVLMDENRVIFV